MMPCALNFSIESINIGISLCEIEEGELISLKSFADDWVSGAEKHILAKRAIKSDMNILQLIVDNSIGICMCVRMQKVKTSYSFYTFQFHTVFTYIY